MRDGVADTSPELIIHLERDKSTSLFQKHCHICLDLQRFLLVNIVLDGSMGEPGRIYKYIGDAVDGEDIDLVTQNYNDQSRWTLIDGRSGSVYEYLGTDVTGANLDLNAQDYSDLNFWKETPVTAISRGP